VSVNGTLVEDKKRGFKGECAHFSFNKWSTLYQERAVFGKMKMDPAKRAQTQNAGEVSSL
jgi:hypothetical protein